MPVLMNKEPWKVYLSRNGKTERVVYIQHLNHWLEVYDYATGTSDIYEFTEVMPATRELFADYAYTKKEDVSGC